MAMIPLRGKQRWLSLQPGYSGLIAQLQGGQFADQPLGDGLRAAFVGFYDVIGNEVFAFDTTTFSIEDRFILNGTPIENSLGNRLIATSDGENLIVNLGNGFEIINLATFFNVCDQVAMIVTCASVTGSPFSSSVDGLMVTVTEEAAFNGTRALIFDGFDVALENAGVINGEIDFAWRKQ